ncbi:hypothetical protein [Myroides odoratus]|uniref:hypothetical protein n=1 Tax=Myroides odoratus TaxID=256 RepID=UPI0007660E74|nr:hypothetical protein [Myroides odoratus]
MKCTLLLLALLLLTSCATVLNEDSRLIYFYSSKNLEKIKVKDSIYELPVQLNLARSKEDLKVVMVTDSTDLNYTIKAHLDNKFLALNLTGLVFAPVNYAVDLTNHRRFEYPRTVYLDPMMADGMPIIQEEQMLKHRNKYINYKPNTKKGDIYFYGTFTPFNYMSFDIPGVLREQKQEALGNGGGEVGFLYYYGANSYLSIGAGGYTSFMLLPILEDFLLYAYTIKVANFHQINRLNLGYGVFWGRNQNREDISENGYNREDIKVSSHNTVGLLAAVNFEVAKNFHVGLSYKPSLYRVSAPKGHVNNHLLSLELIYKLKLRGK